MDSVSPLISVIIPIYKVEPYLRRGLDRVVGQSYGELDIILIDDGSPDRCGEICEEYAARDSRVRVVHQANVGVSAARNTGLKLARGEYVVFVDADDWCEPDMFQYLLGGLRQSGADIAQCGVIFYTQRRKARLLYCGQRLLLSGEAALLDFLLEKATTCLLCNKLYRRSLFADRSFWEGRVSEDTELIPKLLAAAGSVAVLPEYKYHYCPRPDSISGSSSVRFELDFIRASLTVLAFARQFGDSHLSAAYGYVCNRWKFFAYSLYRRARGLPEYQELRRQVTETLREGQEQLVASGQMGRLGKLELRALCTGRAWAFAFSALCRRAYKLRASLFPEKEG